LQDSQSNNPGSPLDPALFADGPARDSRFNVVDRWRQCHNSPADDPTHLVEFTNRQLNEEMNGLECSARNISDFPQAEWDLRMCFARQCADEARHVGMFRRMLEQLGGHVGQYPVMNFQYRIINHADSIVGRLTIQNRTFEAGGLDAVSHVAKRVRESGDVALADFFDSQLADEIGHVRFANHWIRHEMKKDPRNALRMGRAMTEAAKAFEQVMGSEGTEGGGYGIDKSARLEAGFTQAEVDLDGELARSVAAKRAVAPPPQ
jgi:uncharacterized ferritin-like protein (DUF455 family)